MVAGGMVAVIDGSYIVHCVEKAKTRDSSSVVEYKQWNTFGIRRIKFRLTWLIALE
jgi:hypothetical protein